MTTIYIPRLIETAEQAEALPVGTIALLDPDKPAVFENHAAVRVDHFEADGYPWLVDSQGLAEHPSMVGWTALVPIEAKADHIYGSRATIKNPGPPIRSRLVTRWEEA